MALALEYPVSTAPRFGVPYAIAPGMRWLRMPLPFRLDHINLWWIDDGDRTTLIDCGLNRDEVKELWQNLLNTDLASRPPNRLIVTHFHPDHIGLAGWLASRLDLVPWMTQAEWMMAHLAAHNTDPHRLEGRAAYFTAHGADLSTLQEMDGLFRIFSKWVTPVPTAFHRLQAGDKLRIGGTEWLVIIGSGHSPRTRLSLCIEPQNADRRRHGVAKNHDQYRRLGQSTRR